MSALLALVRNGEEVWGGKRVQIADFTGDTSYPTGGYTISPALVGMKEITGVQVVGGNAAAAGILAAWDNVNGKLIFTLPTGGAAAPATLTAPVVAVTEGAITNGAISIAASTATPAAGATPVTSTGAQPAIPVTFGAISQAASSIAAGSGAVTAGIGKEVGNTTNVSTITVRLIFIGF